MTIKAILTTVFLSVIVLIIILSPVIQCETTARSLADPEHPPVDERSVAPIADCIGPLIDIGVHVRQCYINCQVDSEPVEGTTIEMYSSNSQGPPVVGCYKLELSQVYTQFWTMSKQKGPIIHKRLPITSEECENAIKTSCPDFKCDIREPDNLPEEYHYGSDTTVRSTVVMLHSAASALYLDRGSTFISPMGSSAKFNVSDLTARQDQTLYYWKGITELDSCPFEVTGVYGCDKYKMDQEFFYACAKGGMTVTPRKGDPDAFSSKCPGMKIAEEGYFYKVKKGDVKSADVGRVAIEVSPGTQETADASYIRHKVQQLAVKLDHDICTAQCEIMSLEARSSTKSMHLVRAGMESFLMMMNGTAKYCKPLHGCRVSDPMTFCGNPPRIGIVCSGISRFWNPMHPFTATEEPCLRPDTIEELSFNLGSSIYNVDKNLKIRIPNHMIHHRFQNEFLRYHNNDLNMNVKTLSDVKNRWDAVKTGHESKGRVFNTTTSINAPHISLGGAVTGMFKSVFTSVKSIEAVIGVALIGGVIMGSLYIVDKAVGISVRIRGAYASVPTQPGSISIDPKLSRTATEWI
jgi:hypothetical protein